MPKLHPTRSLPPQDYLRECFAYDSAAGSLTWKPRPREHFTTKRAWETWNTRYAAKSAGCPRKRGEGIVSLGGNLYLSHRIIWKLMTGEEPPDTVDHKNRKPSDNRWDNLRPATLTEQNWNQGLRKNRSGFRGVVRRNRKFQARIRLDGKTRHLGYFDTAEEAAHAYEVAARKARGDFHS